MSFNRIAVYGHRGWANSHIVRALIDSGAPITVLYRASSDTSNLPASVKKIEVDVLDEDALVEALRDIDIVVSVCGDEGVEREYGFIKAIPRTNVKLFSPTDLALRYGEEGSRQPFLKAKVDLEQASRDAGIPTTVVLVGNFAEFSFNTLAMGIDVPNNRLLRTGNMAKERLPSCTKDYIAAAYVSIFTKSPISEIQNRVISLSELAPTGDEIAAALRKRHGAEPKILSHSLEKVNGEIEACIQTGSVLALPWFLRKIWATGEMIHMLSKDVWEVEGYRKATLEDIVVEGKLKPYREFRPVVREYVEEYMWKDALE